MDFTDCNGIVINTAFLRLLKDAGLDGFSALMEREGGTVFKKKKARSVVRFELPDGDGRKAFYLKRHFDADADKGGRGLGRFLKAKRPEDACNEWERMIELANEGFLTMIPVAFGEGGGCSLTLTEEIYDSVRVEDYIPLLEAGGRGGVSEKRDIIKRVAALAARFHAKGFNHQDFYLGHIFIRPTTGELFLVDLQRVQRRAAPVERWVVKDLAQFVFSAMAIDNFSGVDLVRFGHAYLGKEKFDADDKKLIRKILAKSGRISRHTVKLLKKGQWRRHELP
jgi:heptose I phosphotransferase